MGPSLVDSNVLYFPMWVRVSSSYIHQSTSVISEQSTAPQAERHLYNQSIPDPHLSETVPNYTDVTLTTSRWSFIAVASLSRSMNKLNATGDLISNKASFLF